MFFPKFDQNQQKMMKNALKNCRDCSRNLEFSSKNYKIYAKKHEKSSKICKIATEILHIL